jgi:NTP pyrophosphatase (non-canonical NTP hydrolase)
MINKGNFRSATLDQWQQAFFELYGDVDKKLPLYDIMLQMVADSTRIAEAMRRGSFNEALPYIPRVFSWLCTMTNKVKRDEKFRYISEGKSLADLIWHKYPRRCAFCAQPKCGCPALRVDDMTRVERDDHMKNVQGQLEAARRGSRPSTLNEWVEMFEDVYGVVNASRSSAQKTFHFLEEIGEVEVELRKADRQQQDLRTSGKTEKIEWEDEIADVFSWLTAVHLHLRGIVHDFEQLIKAFEARPEVETPLKGETLTSDSATLSGQPSAQDEVGDSIAKLMPMLSFSHWVWREFGNKSGDGLLCHRCHQNKCRCKMAERQ